VQHKQSGSDLGSAGPYAILVFWYRAGVTYFVASPRCDLFRTYFVASPRCDLVLGVTYFAQV